MIGTLLFFVSLQCTCQLLNMMSSACCTARPKLQQWCIVHVGRQSEESMIHSPYVSHVSAKSHDPLMSRGQQRKWSNYKDYWIMCCPKWCMTFSCIMQPLVNFEILKLTSYHCTTQRLLYHLHHIRSASILPWLHSKHHMQNCVTYSNLCQFSYKFYADTA